MRVVISEDTGRRRKRDGGWLCMTRKQGRKNEGTDQAQDREAEKRLILKSFGSLSLALVLVYDIDT